MKYSVIISFIVHALFIITLVVWPSERKSRSMIPMIYPVELISRTVVIERSVARVINQQEVTRTAIHRENPVNIPKKHERIKKEVEKRNLIEKPALTAPVTTGVKVDIQNFPYSYYLNILHYRLQNNWQPPYQATAQNKELVAVVGFQVLRDGNIVNVILEKTSGRRLFDQAAQRAVYLANPMPPLPAEFSNEKLSVHIEFEGKW